MLFSPEFINKMIDQQRYVFLAVAQGRQRDIDNLETIIEIIPEKSILDELFQVTIAFLLL